MTEQREDAGTQRGRWRRWAIVGLLSALLAAGMWQASVRVYELALAEAAQRGQSRLLLSAAGLRSALARYDYLPFVLAQDKDVVALLRRPADQALRDPVNRLLEAINTQARSRAAYVMTPDGDTVASSNWRDGSRSYIGHNYAFRPYFTDAMAGRAGRFFAIGVTTREPGYFLSYPVRAKGEILGVAVIKVDLRPLEASWRDGGETIFVTDANGVVFLSTRDRWRYRVLGQLPADRIARLRAVRQYGDAAFDPLPMDGTLEQAALRRRFLRPRGAGGAQRYLVQPLALPEFGWTLHYLTDTGPAVRQGRLAAVFAGVIGLIGVLLALYLRQRQETVRARLAMHDQLERRVAARTRDLAETNRRLEGEIDDRRRAETALRATQEELIQAGKLATLGHMSAALAHEINQPLAAIQTFSASARLLVERGDQRAVRDNLAMIDDLTRRMSRITGQLKTFARKGPATLEAVALGQAIDRSLVLVKPLFDRRDITVTRNVAPPEPVVRADQIRLEQVLINLLRNAADALESATERRIDIDARTVDDLAELRITDRGPGITPEIRKRLFDPFFTTKDVGEGLGLGLALSYGIIRDFGGHLHADNHPRGGAVFTVRLPLQPAHDKGELHG